MWLNQLFTDSPIDFEKRCKTRIAAGSLFVVLGVLAILLNVLGNHSQVLFLEEGGSDFVEGFYTGTGAGLSLAGLITVAKNIYYLKNPDAKKKRAVMETDERNRMLGLRCWAYAGYSLLVLLYVGALIAGFIGKTVLVVLLVVLAVYAVLLLGFKLLLQRTM